MRIYHYILLAAVLLLGACGSEKEPQFPAGDDAVCDLVISLKTGEMRKSDTRADHIWDNDTHPEDPVSFESEIDHVQMYFVAPGNRMVPLVSEKTGESEGIHTYKVTVNLGADYVTSTGPGIHYISGRIIAVANHPENIGLMSPFSIPSFDVTSVDEKRLIPMWGLASISGVRLIVNGTVDDVCTIELLRSVPKITIEMNEEEGFGNYRILKVEPDDGGYNRRAYCHPSGGEDVVSTGNLLTEGCFNPCDVLKLNSFSPVCHGLDPTEGSTCVMFYLAERTLDETVQEPLSFTVTVAREDDLEHPFTGKVYLCDYENGQPVKDTAFRQLVRNHDYRFRISISELLFKVYVEKWVYGGKVHIELE